MNQIKQLSDIKSNIFEFLRYVRIQEPGELVLEYELWPHLRDFFDTLDYYRLNILLKSKQIGISWALAARVLKKIYTVVGANVLEISSGQEEAKRLLQKTQIIYENLPEWMKIYTLYPNSTEEFGFKEMKSRVTALASTEKSGIGETSDWVIHDEADFHDYFKVNLGHTLATVADNPLRELTIVSTVDKTKPDSYFKMLYKAALNRQNSFHPTFYAYNVRPNRDETFLAEMQRENTEAPWAVDANYPQTIEQALSPLAAQSCFNKEKLEKMWLDTIDPDVRQGFIYILYPPRVGTQYGAGVDVGEGVGLDYSSLTILGKQGLNSEVVAKIYINTLATDLFAYEVDKLCKEYFTPLLGVENNAIGVAVINKLKELGYPRLFSSEADRKIQMGKEINGTEKDGWTTGEKNKQTGIIELIESINDGSLTSRFKPQVKEMMEYQWVSGKPVPTGKTHGDTVISLMLAHQMLKRSHGVPKASMYIAGRKIW